jgi:D-glycero-alpha-D-manno-heptose-7-phosphate kinase
VCDNGGWTDTWFAGHGKVCNVAMTPGVEVRVQSSPADVERPGVELHLENYGQRYAFELGALPGHHPLLEAAIDEIGVPDGAALEISVSSLVPAGSSTGTSAAVTVAVMGALAALAAAPLRPDELASTAHRVEVERVGVESGIQDQLCAVHGGISYIEMPSYPRATVTPVAVPAAAWDALERRLVLVYLGRPHRSTSAHDLVIERLQREGPASAHLDTLRATAARARDALSSGDLRAFGQVMQDNTAAQADLHPGLVGEHARTAIDVARAHGAWGWKVNGAGGEGGSVTLLCGPDDDRQRALLEDLLRADPLFAVVPTRISRQGLEVREC